MRGSIRLVIGLLIAAFSFLTYWCNREYNPVTGETQHVNMSADQEIALGLQAAPEMAQQYGGLHQDQQAAAKVKEIGQRIVQSTKARETPYQFDFHLLADESTINAFALPGGQVFITAGLLSRLKTEGQVAGVLGHEIGHVVARHSAEQIAKSRFTQGLTGAAAVATFDPQNPSSASAAAAAAMIGKLLDLKYGRDDELESDFLSVSFTAQAGYDPRAMIGVMEVLSEGGSRGGSEFFQTHPNPENRVARIEQAIAENFPNGLPRGLVQ
ncbi:M48 family metalloprotease [Rufibacter latericius]|uniref:M48 family peptidase n=1 Tax=Rufibacter latericius TaxID=2487040 RepID=A0A3M9MLV0_9BACT|nr:M48 family metalloprotease [Rufibacter latericius]RNI26514.1 M48 family peptidase [Rufibacter latericius]